MGYSARVGKRMTWVPRSQHTARNGAAASDVKVLTRVCEEKGKSIAMFVNIMSVCMVPFTAVNACFRKLS